MGTSIYSFQGTKVHLKMDDELADSYNRTMKAWFQAQIDFEKVHGRKVTLKEIENGQMQIVANEQDVVAYNKVCQFMNKLYDNGLQMTLEECTSDYLVKL